ncbi:MAG: metal ABC transporter permease [Chloroflexi bacterium]|nr:metal ABC transporter permease [Chloroflexota bacterium]
MPEILQYDFMVRALIGGVVVGAVAPALGVFLFLRRLSLIADTLSHVAFMGVAVGIATRTFPPFVALVATSSAAVAIEYLRSRRLLPGDAALAVFLYTSLAVAVVMISISAGFNRDLFGYLFGSVLTITPTDLWLTFGLTVATVGFVVLFFAELAQTSLDADLARTSGVRVDAINLILAVLAGATITLSMRVVGVLLVGTLVVVPVIAALRVSAGLRQTMAVAIGLGVLSATLGLVIAFYADVAPGGSISLTAVGVMLLAFLAGRVRDRMRAKGPAEAGAPEAAEASAELHAEESRPEHVSGEGPISR